MEHEQGTKRRESQWPPGSAGVAPVHSRWVRFPKAWVGWSLSKPYSVGLGPHFEFRVRSMGWDKG